MSYRGEKMKFQSVEIPRNEFLTAFQDEWTDNLDYIAHLQSIINQKKDKDCILLTNKKTKFQNFISLLLTKEKVHIIEKKEAQKNNFIYFFETHSLKQNGQEVKDSFFKEFQFKIKKMINGLKQGTIKGFET